MPQDNGASADADRAFVNGADTVPAVPASIPSAHEPCTMGVGCDQYGVCYAEAHGRPEQCPHFECELEEHAWNWLDDQFTQVAQGRHANDRDYSPDEMVDAFIAGHAQAMEARRAEPGTGLVHDSAVHAPEAIGDQLT